jgi:hypothetical protein
MKFAGELAERLLDLGVAGSARDAKALVVIFVLNSHAGCRLQVEGGKFNPAGRFAGEKLNGGARLPASRSNKKATVSKQLARTLAPPEQITYFGRLALSTLK